MLYSGVVLKWETAFAKGRLKTKNNGRIVAQTEADYKAAGRLKSTMRGFGCAEAVLSDGLKQEKSLLSQALSLSVI